MLHLDMWNLMGFVFGNRNYWTLSMRYLILIVRFDVNCILHRLNLWHIWLTVTYMYVKCPEQLHPCLGSPGSLLGGPQPSPCCFSVERADRWGWRWFRRQCAPGGVHRSTRASPKMEMWLSADFLICIIYLQLYSRASPSCHIMHLALGKTLS